MPRIRTIKPAFFRHEGLQALEAKHKGKYPMFVFEGLWCHCDKLGRFRWRPKTLKLDILPFLSFDMETTLDILVEAGFIKRYEVDGEQYGYIPTFIKHQRINGKEAQEAPEYPDPIDFIDKTTSEVLGKHWGSTGEAIETTGREGKGREQEGNCISRAAISVDEVVMMWNSYRNLAPSDVVSGPIKTLIQRRIKEHPDREWFSDLFARVARSDFLTGKKTDFTAKLDWVLGPKNTAKILNGNYDNREAIHDPNGFLAGMQAFIERG